MKKKLLLIPVFVMTFLALSIGQTTANITFSVDMSEYTGAYTEVQLNGSFNGWCGDCNPMTNVSGDIWEVTLPLPLGDYEYKFTADNWAIQESFVGGESCTVTIGGYTNRALSVTVDETIPTVCWDSCDPCGVSPVMADITFSVDMSEYTGAYTEVQLNGTFNGWCGDCNPMTNVSGDIWEVTLPLAVGDYEYKFTADSWAIQENFVGGEPCTVTNGGYTNRALSVTVDEAIPTVCWDSCDPCGVTPVMADVTFSVDMTEYAGTFTEVQLNGTFNGWCGDCNPMTDVGGNIWEITLPLAVGDYEYKFTADNWAIQESFVGGESCTVTNSGFTNRFISVTVDETIPTVCWNSCDPCGGDPTSANVTFKVDMSDYVGTFTEVQLNGTFNGWCGSCTPMVNTGGDIWEVMVNLPLDTIEYKFTADNWVIQEDLTDGDPCTSTIDGFVNRSLVVEMDEVLDEVCWNSCQTCLVNTQNIEALNEFSISPNPAKDVLTVQISLSEQKNTTLSLVNLVGQTMLENNYTIVDSSINLDTSDLAEGIYFIVLETEGGIISEKVIIQK